MKGKQRSLNGLFWRYLLSTMALLAGCSWRFGSSCSS